MQYEVSVTAEFGDGDAASVRSARYDIRAMSATAAEAAAVQLLGSALRAEGASVGSIEATAAPAGP